MLGLYTLIVGHKLCITPFVSKIIKILILNHITTPLCFNYERRRDIVPKLECAQLDGFRVQWGPFSQHQDVFVQHKEARRGLADDGDGYLCAVVIRNQHVKYLKEAYSVGRVTGEIVSVKSNFEEDVFKGGFKRQEVNI